PMNSAKVNCQPMRTASTMPSSATRLVEANSKAIAATKSAPFRTRERASATAAYEHEDEAAPNAVATASVFGDASGSNLLIARFETTACTMAESVNPRTSGQRISHAIAAAM